jgi:hypothetical protein
MRSRSPTIDPGWITAPQQSLGVVGTLVLDGRVAQAWSDASSLPGYTVGGIAGHVLSLMVGFQRRLEAPGADVEIIRYSGWYRAAVSSNERHGGLIDVGHELARRGPIQLAADLEATGEQLAPRLHGVNADLVIPLASIPGKGVRVDDFLRTRFVELTVHGDDIAESVGLDTPEFPGMAWTLAGAVISETTSNDGEGAAFVLAATRPGRR